MPERVTLQDMTRAHNRARRRKKPSVDMARFHVRSIDGLLDLRDRINASSWSPGPTRCMVARQPKAREIHAPVYCDRVLHHWLIPILDAIYERRFCFDSYANRKGKGLLKAVQRVQRFVRQVHSGQGGGWYLQLDVWNFFYSIDRHILWQMIKPVMQRAGVPLIAQRAVHAALRTSPLDAGVIHAATAAERALIPPHKRLENAARGKGLPIGNLLSQFLANVYLDALDQFIKHVLKVERYGRYVDDLILVHHSREQLLEWQDRIEAFLQERLQLKLKPERKLLPIATGIDFLGYVIRPTHLSVRRRVVAHARTALQDWQRSHVSDGYIRATPEDLRKIQAQWHSYEGHFSHAASWRLQEGFNKRFPWLRAAMVRRKFDAQSTRKKFSIKVHP